MTMSGPCSLPSYEMYAGECLSRLAEAYPDAFELIPRNGKDVPYLKHIPDKISQKIPALLKILNTPYDNVSELERTLTEVNLALEH